MQVMILLLLSHQHFLYFQCFAQKKWNLVVFGFYEHEGMLANISPSLCSGTKEKRKYWMGSVACRPHRDSSLFYLQYKWEWCFPCFASVLDDFHWCFSSFICQNCHVEMSRKFKIQIQAFRTPLDPMCITLWSQKILLIFCTSRLVWDYTNFTNRVERARRNWNNWWKLLNNELNSEAI